MSLNIKSERVHELARRAAKATGGSQTSAIEQALTALLREHGMDPDLADRAARVDRMVAMGERFRREEGASGERLLRVEDLYDDRTGMPR